MRTALVVALLLLCLGVSAGPANAQSTQATGPICFSTAPFPDVLVWFITATGATANSIFVDGNGKDISGNRAQTVAVLVDSVGGTSNLRFGYTTYPSASGFVPVYAGGTINLATGSGPGQCFAPDLASCGDFTMQIIACPATAAQAATQGAQGQQR
jgi:hypothetical protein